LIWKIREKYGHAKDKGSGTSTIGATVCDWALASQFYSHGFEAHGILVELASSEIDLTGPALM
jgi:hypothetical protein